MVAQGDNNYLKKKNNQTTSFYIKLTKFYVSEIQKNFHSFQSPSR